MDKILILLVLVSSIFYNTFTSSLFMGCSFPEFNFEKTGFEIKFPLRCFQRLFFLDLTTQLCHWHDNWYIIGLSFPVLSY